MINLNEMFTTGGLQILNEELSMRVNDWQDVLKESPDDEIAAGRLAVVKKLFDVINEQLSMTTKKLIPEYAREYDHTFIMEATYVNGECIMMECVGWYCGEPNEADTEQYANRDMKADYSV